ncbi:CRAL-TRIO domain-containing protein, partial [Baffinella frigidus]
MPEAQPEIAFPKTDLPAVEGVDKEKVEQFSSKMHKDMTNNLKQMEDGLAEEGGRVATCTTIDEACALLQKEIDSDCEVFSGPAFWGMEAMDIWVGVQCQAFAYHADVRSDKGVITGFDTTRAAARMRKYYLHQVHSKFRFHSKFRISVARIDEVHARIVSEGWFRLLDPVDKKGRLTVLMTMSKVDFDKVTEERHRMVVEYFFLFFHGLMFDEAAQKNGMCYVNDYTGLEFSTIVKMGGKTDERTKKAMHTLMLGALPIKMKSTFLVNLPWWIDVPFKIVLVFMSAKLKERVRFVSKRWRKVYTEVQDQSFWPSTSGGGGPPIEQFPS